MGLGAYLLFMVHYHEPVAAPEDDKAITLTLVAAPEEPPKQPIIAQVVPKPVEPKSTEPVFTPKPQAENAEAIEPLKPAEAARSAPALPVQPIQIKGDGSSPKPGQDTTTQKAETGVKAEPNYLKNPEPPYPPAARRRRQEGLVLISVSVTAQGHAEKAEIKQSSGYPLLDAAALNAVLAWEFIPARIGPQAVPSDIEVPVRFKLSH